MRKKHIYVAVLAGGRGERLWPKSRASLPKQNLSILSKRSFIQDTVRRAKKIAGRNVFVITSKATSAHTVKQLQRSGVKKIIIEPFGRNTAPAVGVAALLAFRKDKDSILIAMPSDAIINKEEMFLTAVNSAIRAARNHDMIVTLGVRPTFAESAYGYIGIGKRLPRISRAAGQKAVKFIEKPSPKTAEKLINSKKFFWNSGIFIFKSSTMLAALKRYKPALYKGLMTLHESKTRAGFESALKRLYGKINNESLDYAILEKAKNVYVIPSSFQWSDLGSFESIARLAKKDENGNLVSGMHIGIDTEKSLVFSDKKRLVATIGVKEFIVVATPDAVLVCNRKKAGDIRKLVHKINKKKGLRGFL